MSDEDTPKKQAAIMYQAGRMQVLLDLLDGLETPVDTSVAMDAAELGAQVAFYSFLRLGVEIPDETMMRVGDVFQALRREALERTGVRANPGLVN